LFGAIVEQLGVVGLTHEKDGCFRRVIIENRSAMMLPSACALNARVLKVLSESQVYRMDHFLGRSGTSWSCAFADGIFEPMWNRDYIDHVQITVAEICGRGAARQILRGDRRPARDGAEPPLPAPQG
jgi:glucose-6-phosphate 1-dehydrogenase